MLTFNIEKFILGEITIMLILTIMLICLLKCDPHTPHLYIVKLECIFALKLRLCVLLRTASDTAWDFLRNNIRAIVGEI